MEKIRTPKGEQVVSFLQANDTVWIGKDLGEALEIKVIYPVLNSLIKQGFVKECDPVERDFTNNKGKTEPKSYKTYCLTDMGEAYVF